MDTDRRAVKLAIEKTVKDAILGIFGDEPEQLKKITISPLE